MDILNEFDIDLIRSRNRKEIERLARSVSSWVYHVVFAYVKNQQDAEEVVQDVIMKTIDYIDEFNLKSSLKTWVYRIAINQAKDLLKYRKRKKRAGHVVALDNDENGYTPVIELKTYQTPETELVSSEMLDIVHEGIKQLVDSQREAMILSKLEHLSALEVASIMEITPKAVEGLLSRGKSNLRNYLETVGYEYYTKRRSHGK